MSGITLAQAETQLSGWLGLLSRLSESSANEVRFEGRYYTAKDFSQVSKQVEFWDRKVKELSRSAGGGFGRMARPC